MKLSRALEDELVARVQLIGTPLWSRGTKDEQELKDYLDSLPVLQQTTILKFTQEAANTHAQAISLYGSVLGLMGIDVKRVLDEHEKAASELLRVSAAGSVGSWAQSTFERKAAEYDRLCSILRGLAVDGGPLAAPVAQNLIKELGIQGKEEPQDG